MPASKRPLAVAEKVEPRPERTILCFSHTRWDFIAQRPQHLMAQLARTDRVIFWEEPRYIGPGAVARYHARACPASGVVVVTPELPSEVRAERRRTMLRDLLDLVLGELSGTVQRWYYTPMMLTFSEHVAAECVVYDVMDDLATFWSAPAELRWLERRLLDQADVVFTGSRRLYDDKRAHHGNVHCIPTSVDVAHFRTAREPGAEPADQRAIPTPRFGFYGRIDADLDLALIAALADRRPDWSIILLGPVTVGAAALPRRANLHYLGSRSYAELPAYLRGWQVALAPFVEPATRVGSIRTLEYLASGRPVVSGAASGEPAALPGVRTAGTIDAFVAACRDALADPSDSWLLRADVLLEPLSWEHSVARIRTLVDEAVSVRAARLT